MVGYQILNYKSLSGGKIIYMLRALLLSLAATSVFSTDTCDTASAAPPIHTECMTSSQNWARWPPSPSACSVSCLHRQLLASSAARSVSCTQRMVFFVFLLFQLMKKIMDKYSNACGLIHRPLVDKSWINRVGMRIYPSPRNI